MTSSSSNNESGTGNPLAEFLGWARVGSAQFYRDIMTWPLFLSQEDGPSYRTLDEAVNANQAQVTEVSEIGSVPELLVINQSPDPLLILDGEELIGAKQNRVVNATLLLPGNSKTIIPVSCTEQGRWHHESKSFSSSEVVMELNIRRAKMQSVSESLKECQSYASHQGAIWDDIQALHSKAGHHSPTDAMHKVFKAREEDMQDALAAFPCQPGQVGLVVSLRGQVVGMDVVSRSDAYARLHGKLVRSYILDVLLEEPLNEGPVEVKHLADFLANVGRCKGQRYPSVGCGESLRFQNDEIAGAALVSEGAVIHVAAFSSRSDQAKKAESKRMARLAERRRRFFRPPME